MPRPAIVAVNDSPTPTRTPRPKRCPIAFVAGTGGPQPTVELTCLLRRRLRIAAAITAASFAVYLARTLLSREGVLPGSGFVIVLGAASAVTFLLTAALWARLPLNLYSLRASELLLFGTAAAFHGFFQFIVFYSGPLVMGEPGCAEHQLLVRVAAYASASRWLILMVLYGVFIPNTWRRCAAAVAVLGLAPLAITVAAVLPGDNPLQSQLPVILIDMSIILAIGAAIAVFGSYRLGELEQEAQEARELGQYRLKARLGAGGMGEVYLGEHTLLRRPCAIKLIRPDQAGDPKALSRFEREVRATAALTHWNTVEIYDYGHADDGTFYYVMEYLPGLSLQEMVDKHGPLPPGRAVHFLRQACAALREAHAAGLIHRDIKPSNLIVCERGGVHDVAKLVDFGLVQGHALAAPSDRLTVQGAILGSPPFMSPEQANGRTDLDPRSDIYSLGATAYFLLTGQPPFQRETGLQILIAHASEPPRPLTDLRPDVPADLQEVVLRCLAKDPRKRFPDVGALDRALAACACASAWTPEDAERWWREGDRSTAEVVRDELAATVEAR
ncbi:MAG TPA: serine/threonine-protein kinase [Gemmataceae bacterium]|nr:serine/threonine-protein kinase [Gemmataceae bacterium]